MTDMFKSRCYTGIGSRETPDDVVEFMERLAKVMADKGWGYYSGYARQADQAFHRGARLSSNFDNTPSIDFLPWWGFEGARDRQSSRFMVPSEYDTFERTIEIASQHHRYWDNLIDSHRKLHARNVHQILGPDLHHISNRVFCWAVPIKEGYRVKGGTGLAVALARTYNVPVDNLFYKHVRDRLERFMDAA